MVEVKPKKGACKDCIHSGAITNYMIYCNKLKTYRALGIRMCVFYNPKNNG